MIIFKKYISNCILFMAVSLVIIACNKETSQNANTELQKNQTQSQTESESDSVMTIEEAFSSALVQDIVGNPDDVDLQYYLEEQIYPLVSKSSKITLDKISSSLYLLSYSEGGTMKNMMIQKFYNPENDEIVFERSDTDLDTKKQFVR